MRILVSLVLLLAFLVPATGLSQDRKIVYKQRTEIDFEDVAVKGELKKPHGAYLLDRRKGEFNPLIKIRTNWNKEIYRSTEYVR